ncbi:SRPBCC family protein [Aeromicrobium sp. Leaf272]|uniref:SRPBCC family protein n=1 Tax=Aeromicrobium sp. Leaf272 TaxID=1736317 RepID=UPI0006FD6244|nr:SRPBCC family protein [Aeromicrobium sp. Leaf272]KQP29340.1 polyketide cyclase [Aeromicrobium sp. Leaf272]
MRQLTVHRHVDVAPDAVWSLLVDLDAWPRWGPSVRRAALDDGGELGLGARGHVWTAVGVRLSFEVTSFDPGRSWAWRVAGVPATTHAVRPDGDGCRASMGAPLWAPAYLPVLAAALVRIDRIADRPIQ